jgi:hypothetical protein
MTTATKTKTISHLSTTPHVKAMVKAMRVTGCFSIVEDDDAETVVATHTASGKEAFRAICKGGNIWIVMRHPQLFD